MSRHHVPTGVKLVLLKDYSLFTTGTRIGQDKSAKVRFDIGRGYVYRAVCVH
jgi:hypothetical protein